MKSSLAVALCVVIFSMALAAQQVTFDWVRGTEFSNFKTYSWRLSPQPVPDATWNARIISYIDAQLAGKGLRRASAGESPDLIVRYIAGVQTSAVPDASGGKASLKIYLADPRKSAVVWTALATNVLSNLSDKDIAKVQNIIREMFTNYPPGR